MYIPKSLGTQFLALMSSDRLTVQNKKLEKHIDNVIYFVKFLMK